MVREEGRIVAGEIVLVVNRLIGFLESSIKSFEYLL